VVIPKSGQPAGVPRPGIRHRAVSGAAFRAAHLLARDRDGEGDLEKWFTQNAEKIAGKTWTTEMEGDVAAFEILVEMKDGKRQLKRVLVQGREASGLVPGLLA
jgi:hypothetical protein